MSLKSTSFPKELRQKFFISQAKQNKSQTGFSRQEAAEDNNGKVNVSPNISFTFLFLKAGVFLQISFGEIYFSNIF